MRHRKLRTVAVVVAVAAALAGCGGSGDSSTAGGTADRQAAPEAPADRQPGEKRGPEAGEPARAVVHTGRLSLEVKDVNRAAGDAIRIAEDAEGFVGRDDRTSADGVSEATVELRIPAAEFTASLKRLAKLGKELEREITAEDVSEELVDLDSRIESMRASVKRTRALLARAQTIGDIASVERELTSRESELASLEARKRALANRVDYSTLTLQLRTRAPAPPPPAEIGFLAGLQAGWHAFKVAVRVVLTMIGASLPFLIALAVPVLGVLLLRRWLRRRPRAVPAEAAAGGAPPPPDA